MGHCPTRTLISTEREPDGSETRIYHKTVGHLTKALRVGTPGREAPISDVTRKTLREMRRRAR